MQGSSVLGGQGAGGIRGYRPYQGHATSHTHKPVHSHATKCRLMPPDPLPSPHNPATPGSGSTEHLDGEKVTPPGPVPLREGTLDVGRVEPCDIVLPVPTVSSRHAILTIEGDKVRTLELSEGAGARVMVGLKL